LKKTTSIDLILGIDIAALFILESELISIQLTDIMFLDCIEAAVSLQELHNLLFHQVHLELAIQRG
jgi:hypothetical protein